MVNVKKRPEGDCPTCGEHFIKARPNQIFCQKKCIRHGGKNHPICPCGVQTDSYMKKYCCTEHRVRWGGKKAPTKMVTHICQNPGCPNGGTFERPIWYPGKKMFCSIDCSNACPSRNRARHYQFGDLNLNSSYELRFVACLERLNLSWEPWPTDRPFYHDGHRYDPDFLVSGIAIEVKGGEQEDHPQRVKREAWNFPEPLVVVDREKLGKLEHIFGQRKFLEALK